MPYCRFPDSRTRSSTKVNRLALSLLCILLVSLALSAPAMASTPQLQIQGGEPAMQENIHAWITLANESCDLPGWRERTLLRNARRDAERAMQALGYYESTVNIRLDRHNDCWALRVDLEPGEPVLIDNLRISISGDAERDPAFIELLDAPPIRAGDIARHDGYERLKNTLVRLASERGYFESRLTTSRFELDPANRRANIVLTLESGPRYHFGHVAFEQDILRDSLIQRFVTFAEGDPFDNRKLLALRQSLSSSGYFNEIRIQTEPDNETLAVPISVTATPRPKYVWLAGIGFATDTGPRLRLGMENRRANRRGHRYNVESEASPVRRGVSFNYEIPLADPNRERINLSTGFVREETDTSISRRSRVGIAHLRELDSGWVATRSLDFERESFEVADQRDVTDLLMPGFELSRTRADHPIFPQRGWRLSGKIRGAEESLGSTVSLAQFRGRAKVIFPVPGGRLLSRLEIGATAADQLVDLPSSVRFFAGGDNSVRGYGYQRLGPENEDGDVIGGRHMMVGSVEYDIPFLNSWSWALFMDGGNAYDRLVDFEPAYGVGTGIRWRSPIGPIRLDLARPSDGRDNVRVHISMGTDL